MADHSKNDLGYPDQLAPDAMKETMKYGNQVANFIQQEWFSKDNGVARFYDNRQDIARLRSYARGEQDVTKYKRELAVDGDLSYLNLDWEPVPVIPKFVDLIVNGIQDKLWDITAYAQDEKATIKRKEDIQILKAEMEKKEELMAIQQQTGINVFENDPDLLPRNTEELDIYTQLNYKQKVEIAAETAIEQIMASNRYPEIRRRITRDITEIGVGAAKHCFDPQKGVVLTYVDPQDLVHSYSDDPNFGDLSYYGEVKRLNVADILQQFPDLPEEKIQKIKAAGARHYDTHGISYENIATERDEERQANHCDVLYFSWKTIRRNIHKIRKKKSGAKVAIKRDESFQGPKTADADFSKAERIEEVVYSGFKILGGDMDLLLKWELEKNMVRPKHSTSDVMLPLVLSAPNYYEGRYDSMVKRIASYADMIQLTYLKIQQVVQKVVPPGVAINADSMVDIDLGNGTSYNPKEALNLFFQTGSMIFRTADTEGDPNRGALPIQELPGSQGQQLQSLISAQAYWYDQIRLATGINEARDASDPDPRALVGVQKMLAANSNVCTRHILDAKLMITKKLAEASVMRMQDVLEFHPLKENFKMSIGKLNTAILDSLDGLHLHDFGIFLELEPDDEDRAKLDQNILQAQSNGQIHLDDVIDIQKIKNLKLANQVLKLRRKQKHEEDLQIQQQQAQAQGEAQAQVAQAAAQAKQQEMQAQAQLEQQKIQLEQQSHIAKLQAEMEFEKSILMLKHELQMQILGSEQTHATQENKQAQGADMKKEQLKGTGAGTGGVGLSSKANTIDNKVKGSGYLQQ